LVKTWHALVRFKVELHKALKSVMPNLVALSAIALFDLAKVLSNKVGGDGHSIPAVTLQHCGTGRSHARGRLACTSSALHGYAGVHDQAIRSICTSLRRSQSAVERILDYHEL
jgi:hypothetical protein